MVRCEISNQDIEMVESLLLPEGAHFTEDARRVIHCWESNDVAACPGSGKTTVLLAKLKLLADRMPFANGSGLCVLSHTNVAVDEIKRHLSDYTDKLLGYPNYIGTIQSFIDCFVVMPYLRNLVRRNVEVVDDLTYAQHMLKRMQNNYKYKALDIVTKKSFESGGQFESRIAHVQALYIREDGSLCIRKQTKALAGADKNSTKQYKELEWDLLKYEGILRYRDAYVYAKAAIEVLPETYTELFSARFKYVFIDEYQDCDDIQRRVIDLMFDSKKCVVIKIGDSDQAIYNSSENETTDWIPREGFLPIATSNRYGQEIADAISCLRKGNIHIESCLGKIGIKPVLLVFDVNSIEKVLAAFINVLEKHGLVDDKGVYKAIGAVRKENSSGLKIGSYWSGFDGSITKRNEYNYWTLIDDIVTYLLEGKLYKAEYVIRKLLCRIFHYAKVKNPISKKEFTISSIKKVLDDEWRDIYRPWIYGLSRLQNIDREMLDCLIREKTNEIIKKINPEVDDVFNNLPEYFLIKDSIEKQIENVEKNVFVDPIRGRRIEFDTIHGVKGETHDATLYLETDRQRASDLSRILPYYGIGKQGKSNLFDYSRKLAYVGMSRPRKLLCVAMQAKTYEKSKGVFVDDWEIIDLRK